jgi:hypothetical protein
VSGLQFERSDALPAGVARRLDKRQQHQASVFVLEELRLPVFRRRMNCFLLQQQRTLPSPPRYTLDFDITLKGGVEIEVFATK